MPVYPGALASLRCPYSSAQVLPEWINRNPADHAFASNGDNRSVESHAPAVPSGRGGQTREAVAEAKAGQLDAFERPIASAATSGGRGRLQLVPAAPDGPGMG